MKSKLLLVFLLVACGGKAATPAPTNAASVDDAATIVAADMEDQIAYMTRYADEACACGDATCAQEVDDRVRDVLIAEAREDIYSDEDGQRYRPPYEERLADEYVRYVRCSTTAGGIPYSLAAASIAGLDQLADRTCACADLACARDHEKTIARWKDRIDTFPVAPADVEAAKAPLVRIEECLDRAYAEAGSERGQDALIALRALREQACACADDTCRAELAPVYATWAKDYAEATMSDRVRAELQEVVAELITCAPTLFDQIVGANRALAALTALRDRACACSDKACADAVTEAFAQLAREHKDTNGSDDAVAAFLATYDEMNGCIADAGGTPPGS